MVGRRGQRRTGHVYISDEIVALMREGKGDAAAESYLRRWRVAYPKVLQPDVAARSRTFCSAACAKSLTRYAAQTPRAPFTSSSCSNDQRRPTRAPLRGQLTFIASNATTFLRQRFLSLIMSVPLDLCLGHKFYTKFLACFAQEVTSCRGRLIRGTTLAPARAEGLSYQWGDADDGAARRRFATDAREGLARREQFPRRTFSTEAA